MKQILCSLITISFAITLAGCGKDETTASAVTTTTPKTAITGVLTSIVNATDADGVVSADCPSGSAISGGGCTCIGGAIFGSKPVAGSYLCGCTAGSADAHAVCGNTTSDSFQGARVNVEQDPAVTEALNAFRARRANGPAL